MNGHGSVPNGVMTTYNSSTPLPYAPPSAKNVYDASSGKSWLFNGWNPGQIGIGETGNKTFTANWMEASETSPGFL